MSVVATAWAQKQTAGSAGRKATLLLLADVSSEHGVLWAGVDYLAEILECNRTTVIEHLKRLEASGLIARIERRKPNGARAGVITVLAPAGARGDMRDAQVHEIYGGLIAEALSRDSRRGDLPEPKSGFTPTLSRDLRPEPSLEPSVNRSADADHVDPSVIRLCDLLADLIRQHDPKATVRPDSKRWRTAMRLLIADRGGSVEEVESVMRWAHAEPFWQSVILSPDSLRKQFTRLFSRHGASGRRGPSAQHTGRHLSTCACPGIDIEAADVLEGAIHNLASQLPEHVIEVWLSQMHAHSIASGRLIVGCPSDSFGWIASRYGQELTRAAAIPVSIVACDYFSEGRAA